MTLFLIITLICVTGLLSHRLHQPLWLVAHPYVAFILSLIALSLGFFKPSNASQKGILILLVGTMLMGLGAHMNLFPLLFHQVFIGLVLLVSLKQILNKYKEGKSAKIK